MSSRVVSFGSTTGSRGSDLLFFDGRQEKRAESVMFAKKEEDTSISPFFCLHMCQPLSVSVRVCENVRDFFECLHLQS